MNLKTTSRATARLRLTALVAVPVLAFSAACGVGDDAGGARESDDIASVPDAPSASQPANSDTGPSSRPAGKSAFYDAQVKYVQCMRTKGGYKDFPDPKLSGHLDWAKVDEIASQPGQMEAAKGGKNAVCGPELQNAMTAEPKRDQQKDYESMLAHAKCMRDNGVSKFTNPTMSGGNAQPGGDPNPASPSIDHESPSYKQAREACKTKLLDGLDGMQ
ncbi:hypothetical protein OG883_29540 [Streptomyces sp. NBC_01142]|uniref:hypothetical protein n=1 Tax=Streptomyces sp. NBC_01142 TaxID=2975865 RepID=UPI0022509934|nr:hypothetical protein [Streptomyces sp. NBC_01142]MCX4823945.1 hypothetical protein [Streptomyces sp. NBC_01142]